MENKNRHTLPINFKIYKMPKFIIKQLVLKFTIKQKEKSTVSFVELEQEVL